MQGRNGVRRRYFLPVVLKARLPEVAVALIDATPFHRISSNVATGVRASTEARWICEDRWERHKGSIRSFSPVYNKKKVTSWHRSNVYVIIF